MSLSLIIIKINHMLLLWFSAAPQGKKVKLEVSIATARRSLEFIGLHSQSGGANATGDEVSIQDTS